MKDRAPFFEETIGDGLLEEEAERHPKMHAPQGNDDSVRLPADADRRHDGERPLLDDLTVLLARDGLRDTEEQRRVDGEASAKSEDRPDTTEDPHAAVLPETGEPRVLGPEVEEVHVLHPRTELDGVGDPEAEPQRKGIAEDRTVDRRVVVAEHRADHERHANLLAEAHDHPVPGHPDVRDVTVETDRARVPEPHGVVRRGGHGGGGSRRGDAGAAVLDGRPHAGREVAEMNTHHVLGIAQTSQDVVDVGVDLSDPTGGALRIIVRGRRNHLTSAVRTSEHRCAHVPSDALPVSTNRVPARLDGDATLRTLAARTDDLRARRTTTIVAHELTTVPHSAPELGVPVLVAREADRKADRTVGRREDRGRATRPEPVFALRKLAADASELVTNAGQLGVVARRLVPLRASGRGRLGADAARLIGGRDGLGGEATTGGRTRVRDTAGGASRVGDARGQADPLCARRGLTSGRARDAATRGDGTTQLAEVDLLRLRRDGRERERSGRDERGETVTDVHLSPPLESG